MSGGSKKNQVVGYRYSFGIHMGIGRGPVDAINEVKVGDRTAWIGTVTDNGTINIDQPDLFGGDEKEGGVQGPLEVMMGGPGQTASAGLVAMRGSNLPGYRRRLTMFFNGLISANNPYPKPWKFRLNRILKGWDGEVFLPGLAKINMGAISYTLNLVNISLTGAGSVNTGIAPGPIAPGTSTNYTSGALRLSNINAWDLRAYTSEGYFTYAPGFASMASIEVEKTVVEHGLVFHTSPDDDVELSRVDVAFYHPGDVGLSDRTLDGGLFWGVAKPSNEPPTPGPSQFFVRITERWATAFVSEILVPLGTDVLPDPSVVLIRVNQQTRSLQVLINGVLYAEKAFPALVGTMYGVFPDSGGPGHLAADLWEFNIKDYIVRGAAFQGINAMNPAHIIYECLTNREWGRGLDRTRLDEVSFTTAALTLATEGFGLCTKWTRTDEIEVFIQRIIDTVGATLYVDRSTALLTLKLIRGDYDIDDLPFFDNESGLLEVRDSAIGVIGKSVNSVSVVWHDPYTDEDRKITVNNPASLLNAGGVANSVTKDFKAIPSATLATRVAQRELRAVSTSLRRVTAVFDRRAESVTPGSVIAMQDLKRGIPKTAFRVGRVEDGTIADGRITLTLVQDVFGLPANAFVSDVPTQWTPPDTTPCVPSQQRVFEAPYFMLARTMTKADFDYISSDGAYLGTLSAQGKALNLGYRINVRSGAPEVEDTSGDDYACEV